MIGKTIKLTGKTAKGRQRIQAVGTDIWTIEDRKPLQCLRGRMGLGIWPVLDSETDRSRHWRWIEAHIDPDFSWCEVIPATPGDDSEDC